MILAQWENSHRNIAFSLLTVPLIFITPAILNRQDPFHITGRILTPVAVILAGGVVLKSAGKIEELQPQIEKVKTQQMNFLGHGLGTEVYLQQQQNTLLAAKRVMELTEAIDPEIPQFPPEPETGKTLINKELPDLQPSGNLSPGNSETSGNSAIATLEASFPQQELDVISRAISEGFTDTQIVTDIMGCKGRQYQSGKERLFQIKKYLGVQNDN